ncbi:MAG: hypothetical protein EPO24_09515 [Bacteroidetes bacterium]|nr:MAG: hypothetical protein EPO24_09515 [Bacteroidota bacterium]
MKTYFIIFILLALTNICFSNTIIVDINGAGQFTSINAAIQAATANDTVKVWPGTYSEQVTLNKNLTLMGSGYENTIINGSYSPTVSMSSGKLQWLMISSLAGTGINLSGGIIKNCVVNGCTGSGIATSSGSGQIYNCVIVNNGGSGIIGYSGGFLTVVNCIVRFNGSTDINGDGNGNCYYYGSKISLSYSNYGSATCTQGNQGCITTDPVFSTTTDFHISQGSPCWDKGNQTLQDPDGSQSDMGYFGGPDCPIYPTVFEIHITPSGNTINLQAKGRANY